MGEGIGELDAATRTLGFGDAPDGGVFCHDSLVGIGERAKLGILKVSLPFERGTSFAAVSRLPQLYMNQVRKSTAGLSPALFAAAFFGNLFYSTSLLTNPCAWYDYAPGEGSGWVDPQGSVRENWVLRAAPFFFGAAGVLLMDAAVGLQFWYFGDAAPRGRSTLPRDDEVIITVDDHGKLVRRSMHWRRVSGWMRGWAPAVSVAATPNVSRANTPIDSPRESSPASLAGSSSSKSIPIKGKGSALDEARALLGTSRHASPRSYGAVGSPR